MGRYEDIMWGWRNCGRLVEGGNPECEGKLRVTTEWPKTIFPIFCTLPSLPTLQRSGTWRSGEDQMMVIPCYLWQLHRKRKKGSPKNLGIQCKNMTFKRHLHNLSLSRVMPHWNKLLRLCKNLGLVKRAIDRRGSQPSPIYGLPAHAIGERILIAKEDCARI